MLALCLLAKPSEKQNIPLDVTEKSSGVEVSIKKGKLLYIKTMVVARV